MNRKHACSISCHAGERSASSYAGGTCQPMIRDVHRNPAGGWMHEKAPIAVKCARCERAVRAHRAPSYAANRATAEQWAHPATAAAAQQTSAPDAAPYAPAAASCPTHRAETQSQARLRRGRRRKQTARQPGSSAGRVSRATRHPRQYTIAVSNNESVAHSGKLHEAAIASDRSGFTANSKRQYGLNRLHDEFRRRGND